MPKIMSTPFTHRVSRQWQEAVDTPMGVMDVHCAATSGTSTPKRLLVVLHGKDRAAERYCRQWRDAGNRNDLLIAVPRFDRKRFPSWRDYNLAGMLDPKRRLTPPSRWLFPTLAEICNEIRRRHNIEHVDFFGHSAGAQLLFRYALFSGSLPYGSQVIVANAGWYTLPSYSNPFPYGLVGGPEDVDLRNVFSHHLTLLTGGRDIDGNHHSLRQDSGARRQGAHRPARAHHCFETARGTASDLDVPFRWQLKVVPKATHSNADMAPVALDLLVSQGVADRCVIPGMTEADNAISPCGVGG
ncbi:MAG: hypothetical protein AAGA73_15605 [Pseudomonadota bacterium]